MQKKIYPLSIGLMGFLLFWYVLQRAALLSLTHDEAATTDLVSVSLHDIMFSPLQFQTANNHILHSIFMKWSVQVFGWKEWSIRLPNVLSFILYYGAAVGIMQLLTKNNFIRITGIFIFCSVPYLLDFFSLARGYGMANAFSLAAFLYLILFFEKDQRKYLLLCFVAAALSVYSNFTWLNFYAGLWLLLNVGTLLFRQYKKDELLKTLLRNNLYPLLISVILIVVSYQPIGYLQKQDEFRWGSADWLSSVNHLMNDLLYGHSLFNMNQEKSALFLSYFFLFVLILPMIVLTKKILSNYKTAFTRLSSKIVFFILVLIVSMVVSTIVQRYLFHTFYIDGRKASLYIPLLLCLLTAVFVWIFEQQKTAGNLFFSLIGTVFLIQFLLSLNFKSCREWWYDANSKEAYLSIIGDSSSPKKTAVNWLFIHSFNVYNNHFFNHDLPMIQRTDEIKENGNAFDYYYIIGDEIRNLSPIYKPVKRYFWDRFLLKKDLPAYEQQLLTTIQANPRIMQDQPIERQRILADSILVTERKNLNWSGLFFTE